MRVMALLIIAIPGIVATLGVKLMRDAFFGDFYPLFFNVIIQFFAGLLLFILGIAFIGGFILYRDKKRNLTKGRFENKRNQ